MKSKITVVAATAVTITLLFLSYLLLCYQPSANQILCGISNLVAGNDLVYQTYTVSEQSDASQSTVDDEAGSNASETGTDVLEASSGFKEESEDAALRTMLATASTPDKTVIITTLNQAWAAKNTMIDIFLESFHKGENIQFLLNHLVIVALDQTSYDRCQELHNHCLMLKTKGVDFSGNKGFMSKDFLKMMWRRMRLLRTILEMGYNFVFTDADILWFRNPFERFANNTDFQISSDKNRGNAWSLRNKPNCGFQYARSNERTIAMYRHWCKGGDDNPDIDEQSLLTVMLKGQDFAAFKVEQKSKNISKVVTMHANCCTGLNNKVQDLRLALNDWEGRASLPPTVNASDLWRVPKACRHSVFPSPPPPPQLIDPSENLEG